MGVTKRGRLFNKPWKRIYGVDRKYTRRVDRANERAAQRTEDEQGHQILKAAAERYVGLN